MAAHRFVHLVQLRSAGAPQPAQVVVETAALDELRQRQLQQLRRGHGRDGFQRLDLALVAPCRHQPTRSPGARILLNRLHSSTVPLRSNAASARGRSLP